MLLEREANKLYFIGFGHQDWNYVCWDMKHYNTRCIHIFTIYDDDIISDWFNCLVALCAYYRKMRLKSTIIIHTLGFKTADDIHKRVKDKDRYKSTDYMIDSANSFLAYVNDHWLDIYKEPNKVIVSISKRNICYKARYKIDPVRYIEYRLEDIKIKEWQTQLRGNQSSNT